MKTLEKSLTTGSDGTYFSYVIEFNQLFEDILQDRIGEIKHLFGELDMWSIYEDSSGCRFETEIKYSNDQSNASEIFDGLDCLTEIIRDVSRIGITYFEICVVFDEISYGVTYINILINTVRRFSMFDIPLSVRLNPRIFFNTNSKYTHCSEKFKFNKKVLNHEAVLLDIKRVNHFDHKCREFVTDINIYGDDLNVSYINKRLNILYPIFIAKGEYHKDGSVATIGHWRLFFDRHIESSVAIAQVEDFIQNKKKILKEHLESWTLEIDLAVYVDTVQMLMVPFYIHHSFMLRAAEIESEVLICIYSYSNRKSDRINKISF